MGTYRLTDDDRFVEYQQARFGQENIESDLEDWLEKNPHVLIEGEQILYIGRQVVTQFGKAIDLLAVDSRGDSLIIELKKDRTPRDVVAQALEYAAAIEPLEYQELNKIAIQYFDKNGSQWVSLEEAFMQLYLGTALPIQWNIRQHLFIVAQRITPEIISVARYLRRKDIDIKAIQFNYYKTGSGERRVDTQVIVGTEPLPTEVANPDAGTKAIIGEAKFLEMCDQGNHRMAKELYFKAKELRDSRRDAGDFINWGTSGYSYRVKWEGNPNGEVIFIGRKDGSLTIWRYVVEKSGQHGAAFWKKLHQLKSMGDRLDRGNQPTFSTDSMTSEELNAFIKIVGEFAQELPS